MSTIDIKMKEALTENQTTINSTMNEIDTRIMVEDMIIVIVRIKSAETINRMITDTMA